ncbi:hypothetical protein Zm00014a_015740 [Zea mays]|uniref:Arf-GAP domain-containing protein n=2 Tax=Zea mays TaxID=4577 RepID=A0A3L6EEW8_MAIZE|nr:hypothetical protein Zm00014a_015740 [Zea mays]
MGSGVKEDERNEKIIRGLLKLPGNRRCINCNSLGPQYVCTSFSTFICTNCSGIHREFSHRVKSVSMAKFTSQEVSALQEGGNERAKEIYFKHWDLQGPVIDSSDVHRLRNFIKNVYVERRYSDQRIGGHLAQAKIQGNQDSYGNSNADSSPGVLRSAVGTYEDNHNLKRTKESLSENQNNSNGHPVSSTVDQNNNSTIVREKVDLRSHLHPDDLLKTDGKSKNNHKVVIASASSAAQASKEINSNKVFLPIKLPDPPRSQKATSSSTSTEAQKPSSSRTDDPSPATLKDAKLYMSKNLIDFDSELEPPQGVAQTDIQKGSSPQTDVGWATFDDATSRKTTTMPSTSSKIFLEGPMLHIADLTSAPQIRFSNAKSLSFAPSNCGNQLNQQNFSPVNTTQYSNTLLNRATSAPVHSQGSNMIVTHNPAIVSASQQPAAEATSNRGKALPDGVGGCLNNLCSVLPLFFFLYAFVLKPGSFVGYFCNELSSSIFSLELAIKSQCKHATTQLAHPYPVNPVSLAGGPASAHASTRFPSLTSMQEALPNLGSTAVLSRAPVHQYMVQQHTVQVPNYTFPSG